MKAVILAAGRGSRMQSLTERKPKCLVVLAGRPLLFWQSAALAAAGVDRIAVVLGYRGDMVRSLVPELPVPCVTLENPRWATTNMLSTLHCAAAWIDGEECVISYSDIVYPAGHVRALMSAEQPVALTYDRQWERLWRLRNNGNPLEDAETFQEKNGLLQEIGGKPDNVDQVRGQYMGLLKLTSEGLRIWFDRCRALGTAADLTDMTGFLRLLLSEGAQIGAVPVDGAWCEVDSGGDLECYETALRDGTFSHDWRNRE
ncbi:MAG: phosphocholine cytidylyltransferase family protein [Desulfovibrio sp.]|jgi:choline kinase|nr:phosphocholine cytidylyltransferase family protein [Desulfovibrio sp.]